MVRGELHPPDVGRGRRSGAKDAAARRKAVHRLPRGSRVLRPSVSVLVTDHSGVPVAKLVPCQMPPPAAPSSSVSPVVRLGTTARALTRPARLSPFWTKVPLGFSKG